MATPIIIAGEHMVSPVETTLEAFLAANDGFDAAEIADIRGAVQSGLRYHGGGGASPTWWIAPRDGSVIAVIIAFLGYASRTAEIVGGAL